MQADGSGIGAVADDGDEAAAPDRLAANDELREERPPGKERVSDFLNANGMDTVSVDGGTSAWARLGRPLAAGLEPR